MLYQPYRWRALSYAADSTDPTTRTVVNRCNQEGLPARGVECGNARPLVQQIPSSWAPLLDAVNHGHISPGGQRARVTAGEAARHLTNSVWRAALRKGRLQWTKPLFSLSSSAVV